MKRDDEDRILHGLYFFRESIDEEMQLTGEQILWLSMHPLESSEGWTEDGQPRSLDTASFPSDVLEKLFTVKLELPLRYLQYRRLIKLNPRTDNLFHIAVTFAGADRAIRMHTRRGRLDLWYREHKDGIAGVSLTVFTAFLTSLITVLLLARVLR